MSQDYLCTDNYGHILSGVWIFLLHIKRKEGLDKSRSKQRKDWKRMVKDKKKEKTGEKR